MPSLQDTLSQGKKRTFILASRTSQLAQTQTYMVRDLLREAFPSVSFDTSFMTTGGDRNQTRALYLLGGKSLWTKDLEVALAEGAVDMLVHCYKDVPTVLPEGCEIAGVLERENPLDSLVMKKGLPYRSLEDLPDGSVIGTSSVRRVAQLKRMFPKLVFKDARGNLDTRIAKLDADDSPFTALVLAKAGLLRLGWSPRITADIGPPTLFYAVGQGALALEIRSNDVEARAFCRALTHTPTEWSCAAERACLRVLEGGCSVPVGVSTELVGSKLKMIGCVTSLTGDRHVQLELEEEVTNLEEAEAMGAKVARILKDHGATSILDEVNTERERRVGEEKIEEGKGKIEGEIAV